MNLTAVILSVILSAIEFARAKTTHDAVTPILQVRLQTPQVVRSQLLTYLLHRATPLEVPASSELWTAEAARLRKHVLEDVILHGWPREWIAAPPRFELVDTINTTQGYRIRKLRYEIVPGFWSAALLYEPETLREKAPAVLNLLGHYKDGKAMAF